MQSYKKLETTEYKSFLDIDLLLSEEERVPVIFKLPAKGLGHLDPFLEDHDEGLQIGSKAEVPLWLAKEFEKKNIGTEFEKKNIALMETPKHFGNKMREEIKAGSSSINLRDYSNYFYEVGLQLSFAKYKQNSVDSKDLQYVLRKAFCGEKFKKLMVNSLTNANDASEFSQGLTCSELVVFNAGIEVTRDVAQWKARRSCILKASILGKRNSNDGDDSNGKRR